MLCCFEAVKKEVKKKNEKAMPADRRQGISIMEIPPPRLGVSGNIHAIRFCVFSGGAI
jgi:hypothetical protein